jgi:hypothetical protein
MPPLRGAAGVVERVDDVDSVAVLVGGRGSVEEEVKVEEGPGVVGVYVTPTCSKPESELSDMVLGGYSKRWRYERQ